MNIGTIIVTFNRKDLLVKCIKAVLAQTCMPDALYVIDNASTDGTKEKLEEEGLLVSEINGVSVHYVRLQKNSGGAGGFYTGMKIAYEDGCDAVWMMDDDGLPEKNCLKNLLSHLQHYDYLSPLVIDIKDEDMMAFEGCTVAEFLKREVNGVVKGCANPFNGVLYSKKLIEAVGYPKKEMFIWGDEINYDMRARRAGFQPVMVTNAIHRHPLNRQPYVRYFGHHMMVVPEQDWKLFCYVRNKTYNTKIFYGSMVCMKNIITDFLKFGCYYMKINKPEIIFLVIKAFYKGLKEDIEAIEVNNNKKH